MSDDNLAPLRTALVGCNSISRWHIAGLAALDEFELIALCDTDDTRATEAAAAAGVGRVYSDYEAMLKAEQPDVVCVCTPNDLHAPMTLSAIESGARAVYCEKPMATCLADGRAMVTAAREREAVLAVNHQRRLSAPIRAMRRLIDEGAVGGVRVFRGSCAGDLLSDATHLIDTIRYLAGDPKVEWVFGAVHRVGDEAPGGGGGVQLAERGFRYGHPVETGAMAVIEFETGVRAELFCGDMRLPDRSYGDYEVIGTEGRLWRAGDAADPPVLINDCTVGGWRAAPTAGECAAEDASWLAEDTFRRLAVAIHDGEEHPLSGESALADLEIIMAIYESARLYARIVLPLDQPRFPLEIMMANAEA